MTFPANDPLWYKDAIIYELHVRAFYDSNGDGVGDFSGLVEKLDYIHDLGANCIWLLPFYPSPLRDDGYDISDYYGINPIYGTHDDFQRFIDEAHRRGIRVITELVINHTSDQHPWFQRARHAPPGSPERDFYVWSDSDRKYRRARIIFTDTERSNWTWDPVANSYYWHRFFHHQPDLNFDNPLVVEEVINVMHFWLKKGVDGLRLDAIPYLIEREGTICENLPETHVILKRFRREMDRYPDQRLFLAEANQWPEDVRPYFGDGDECHMAFHFPLMPRIFMALRQEDRHPITEILEQTPDIPARCQWALFLRNHDELTLEMVTDEERDYMYREYAADPVMRINIGIRRRLAPLVDNSRRRIELLNSLLLSLPGTPVIYYGDEIGMGDNIYLGDRNGVRTPMQWSGDRNAGFSRADFARLYAATVMDPVYGYAAVNVESQERHASSLLQWSKRMIALRKAHRVFGRGSFQMLHPPNRKILAYIRSDENETILAVANLSRFAQPAELDLSRFQGFHPIEMFGSTPFPRIGALPYFLTLAPHAFYWFVLKKELAAMTIRSQAELPCEAEPHPLIQYSGPPHELFDKATRQIEKHLPRFLARQRWFEEKESTMRSARIADWTPLRQESPESFLVMVETRRISGETETYFVPMAVAFGEGARFLLETNPIAVIARLDGSGRIGVLHDALADDFSCTALLAAIRDGRRFPTNFAAFDAFTIGDLLKKRGIPEWTVARTVAARRGTALVFARKYYFAVIRKFDPTSNPGIEVPRFLAEKTSFENISRPLGAIEYVTEGHERGAVGVLQEYIHNQGRAWDRALTEIKAFYPRAEAKPELMTVPNRSRDDLTRPPPDLTTMFGAFFEDASGIGRMAARMHIALASSDSIPAFTPERWSMDGIRELASRVRLELLSIDDDVAREASKLSETVRRDYEVVRDLFPVFEEFLETAPRSEVVVDLVRIHGDFHLGQLLWANNNFIVIDFEENPWWPRGLKSQKQCALRDVVAMVRSFGYAAYAGLFERAFDNAEIFARLQKAARCWEAWMSASFLDAYRTEAEGRSFLPKDGAGFGRLASIFFLERILAEFRHEIGNRPEWVRIPIEGLRWLADEIKAGQP